MKRQLKCESCGTVFNLSFEWARQIQKENWCPVCGVEEKLKDVKEE